MVCKSICLYGLRYLSNNHVTDFQQMVFGISQVSAVAPTFDFPRINDLLSASSASIRSYADTHTDQFQK